ncbi:2-dehydropantoate 2-reductase N-terminal domain-containing protein, partial [Micrococcus sp. SIMBA_144]
VVTVVCRRKHQADQLRKGINYINRRKTQCVKVQATHHLSSKKTDLLIVAVKSNQVPSVLSLIKEVYQDSNLPDILFIQNGMGHLSFIK